MSCVHPFHAFKTGYKTEIGKDDLILVRFPAPKSISLDSVKKRVSLDNAPHHIENGHVWLDDPAVVPCGSCVGCRMNKAKEWKIRNCLELMYRKEAYFITLTYDDAHLPRDDKGLPVLVKSDLQNFFKRLRNYIDCRYFACGEYGELTGRCHFHILLYAHLDGFRLVGVNRFTNDLISKCWTLGNHLVEEVTPGSIAYVSGYVEKKQNDPNWHFYSIKPFITMSRKPGIGMEWLADHMDVIKATKKVYGRFADDVRATSASLPKAFKDKLAGLDWFEEWKELAKLNEESTEATIRAVYRLVSSSLISDSQEAGYIASLTKKRRTSL